MSRKILFTIYLLIGMLVLAACTSNPVTPTSSANMPNPASVFCEQNGGKLDLRQEATGGVAGICVFSDGSECDEWAFYRGECKSGEKQMTVEPTVSPRETEPAPTATVEIASDGWKIYRNENLGYSFHYPADTTIIPNDEPLKSLSITGPLVDNESWPQITISHPGDREDFRPPEGVDLGKWLTDHNLLMTSTQDSKGEVRQPDLQIAGTTAIHTRLSRSPQTYAYDKYYFAKSGQLYMIVIGHTGDKEDWELYNHFLQNIQFVK